MPDSLDTVGTQLADIHDLSFQEILERTEELAPYAQTLQNQVRRRRVNLGGGGPPGRAD